MNFDDVTRLAAQLCRTPMALVSLVEEAGPDHAQDGPDLLVVPDTTQDPRFATHPLVTGDPVVRFYAGAPLVDEAGHVLGALCVLDVVPRDLTAVQREQLGTLARQVVAQLTLHRQARESERSWRTLFGASPVGVGLCDERGRFVAANPALCALLGRPESEVVGHCSAEFTHPDDLDPQLRTTQPIGAADDVLRIERRYVRPDGEVRCADVTVTPTSGPAEQAWTLAHVQDITERKATERAIVDSEANLKAVAGVISHIQDGSDARQTIVDSALDLAQAAYVSLVEHVPAEGSLRVSATSDADLLGVRTPVGAASATAEVFRTGEPLFLPDPADHPLVDPRLLQLTGARSIYIVPVRSGASITAILIVAWAHRVATLDDRRAGVVTLLADQCGVALRQAALVAELESLALTDPLTGLPNRRNWDHHLEYLFALSSRGNRPLTIALADLDHFKAFNDTRGHQAGDDLLRRFATVARGGMRAVDTIARWGGEEFAISLPGCHALDAEPVLDRIRSLVPLGQTCSIGYATWDGTESSRDLLARVDEALYAAKAAGRDRVRAAAPSRTA